MSEYSDVFVWGNIPDISLFADLLKHIPPTDAGNALLLSERFSELLKEGIYSPENLLNYLQEYFRKVIHSNISNRAAVSRFISL